MKAGFGDDLPPIGGGAFLGRAVFKHYAHGFLVGRGEPDCGPGVGPVRRMKRPLRIASASNATNLQEELVGAPHFLTGVALVQQCGGTHAC
jgi:hypothetical protein